MFYFIKLFFMKKSANLKNFILIAVILISNMSNSTGQAQVPEVLQSGSMEEQLDYIQERTRIYENFRAIREDMFQLVKNNSLDSLNQVKADIRELAVQLEEKDRNMDSLNMQLAGVREELNLAVENRDRLFFLGIPMQKSGYNLLVWSIIVGLSLLFVLGLLIYLRNRAVTVRTLKDIDEIKDEFETFRKRSRETKERLVMDHFNELKKYKNSD